MTRPPAPRDPARRTVVTGLGAVTPVGNDVDTFWANLTAGVSGVGPITLFDASDLEVRIAPTIKQVTVASSGRAISVFIRREQLDDVEALVAELRRRIYAA